MLRRTGGDARPSRIALHEHQRIIHCRVGLGLKNRAAIRQRVAHRAVHLRDAAQRVRILHSPALAMRLAKLAALEHAPQIGRRLKLSSMRPRAMDAFIERDIGSAQSVERQRSNHVGGIDQNFCRQQRQCSYRQHGLGAVDQRDCFFGFEHQRLDAGRSQDFRAGNARAFFVQTLAFADQHQRQMSQRRQVSARPHAALRRHKRRDLAVQHLAKRVDHDRANAGVSLGKGIGAQQHHGADFRRRERIADPNRMRTHQVHLQLANLVSRNANVAEFADARGDRVRNLIARYQRVYHGARPIDGLARIRRQQHRTTRRLRPRARFPA